MATTLFFSFLGSLIICMALIPPLTASAGRLQMLDLPGGRKTHPHSIAKVGGIALAVGTFVGVLMWGPKDDIVVATLLGGIVILLFGIWDDRVGLNCQIKFAGQALAVLTVLAFGGVRIAGFPLIPDDWFGPWISLPLTFLILIAVTNAVNLSDGLDGLAGGLSMISFCGMAYLALQTDDVLLLLIVVSVLGGLLGFLRFNSHPAKIFMGDAGSQFLGFCLGVTGLMLTNSARGPFSIMLAPFIWGLPLLDTLGVIVQRLREGRSPFIGDRNHLHHKLLAVGLSQGKAVVVIYVGQVAMVALGYGLRWQPDWMLAVVYSAIAIGVLGLFLWPVEKIRLEESLHPPVTVGFANWLEGHPGLARLPMRILAVAVSGFLLVSVTLPSRIPQESGIIAGVLLFLLSVGAMVLPRMKPFYIRTGLYVGTTFALYFGEMGNVMHSNQWFMPVNLFLIGVAVLVMFVMRFGTSQQFEMTPLDSLMILLAVALPFLPSLEVGEINISVLAAKLIVLFFAFELLLHAYAKQLVGVGLMALWVLGGLAVRAWW